VGLAAAGCSEVRGRHLLQKANQQYRSGQYAEAVATFEEAERFVPDLWLLWINKGYTCRSMMVPGAKTAATDAAVTCALAAFKRLQELAPSDPRGPALYVQTLFDAERFEDLARMYQGRFAKDRNDGEALQGLIQVYSKWPNHLDEALEWQRKKVELSPNDAEAHYSTGVFIWQQLFARGGGADRAAFDPRPDPNKPRQVKIPPAMSRDDLVGQQRVDLADEGIHLLEKAVQLRPKYHEAMAYVNLLYRQKSYAYFGQPKEWQKCVDLSTEWRNRTLLAMGKPVPKGDGSSSSAAAPSGEKVQPTTAETAGAGDQPPEGKAAGAPSSGTSSKGKAGKSRKMAGRGRGKGKGKGEGKRK
jgi:tetratricopeptide (TPR) repeat protein